MSSKDKLGGTIIQDVSGSGKLVERHSVDLEILDVKLLSTFNMENEALLQVWGRLIALSFGSAANVWSANGASESLVDEIASLLTSSKASIM